MDFIPMTVFKLLAYQIYTIWHRSTKIMGASSRINEIAR